MWKIIEKLLKNKTTLKCKILNDKNLLSQTICWKRCCDFVYVFIHTFISSSIGISVKLNLTIHFQRCCTQGEFTWTARDDAAGCGGLWRETRGSCQHAEVCSHAQQPTLEISHLCRRAATHQHKSSG